MQPFLRVLWGIRARKISQSPAQAPRGDSCSGLRGPGSAVKTPRLCLAGEGGKRQKEEQFLQEELQEHRGFSSLCVKKVTLT